MQKKDVLFITQAAAIAALYVVLTAVAAGFDLASGMIQVRFSEALCVLPFFTAAAVPGVTIGCLIANIVTGCMLPDVIFGTLATAIGAIASWYLRKNRILVAIPPIVSNAIIIPLVLTYAYKIPGGIPLQMLTVGAGEVISCMIIGQIILSALYPFRQYMFGNEYDNTVPVHDKDEKNEQVSKTDSDV